MDKQSLLEVSAPYGGCEVLRVIPVKGLWEVRSVPVFAMGVSRGTLVDATAVANSRLRLNSVVEESPGGTLRLIFNQEERASQMYRGRVADAFRAAGLPLGPGTIFDPQVLALHLPNRNWWQEYTSVADRLAQENAINFWELGDPDVHPAVAYEGSYEPWELIHPMANDDIARLCNTDEK